MITASALILLAQISTPCTTAGTPRLGGGAMLVRPITGFEPAPFERLGPATGARKTPDGIQQTSAQSEEALPDLDRSSQQQCEALISVA